MEIKKEMETETGNNLLHVATALKQSKLEVGWKWSRNEAVVMTVRSLAPFQDQVR